MFLPEYVEQGILEEDPFQVLDREGVGTVVEMGVQRGRATKPDLKVGICGEHGGDPSSIEFCYQAGMKLRLLLPLPRPHRPPRRRPRRPRHFAVTAYVRAAEPPIYNVGGNRRGGEPNGRRLLGNLTGR